MKVIITIMQLITIQFAVTVRKDYTPLRVYMGCVWVVIYVKYITYEGLLHNTLALDVDTMQETCILWAQSVDRPDPWIALRNLWILTSRRNPWIAQGSCLRDLWILPNFAYTTNNYTMVIPRWRRHIIWIDW